MAVNEPHPFYTPKELELSKQFQAEGMEPLLANILAKEPRAPEYARLYDAYLCHGGGYARGERLVGIFHDALETVKRLEIGAGVPVNGLVGQNEPLATWRRFYNMARRPSSEKTGLTVERSEFYADRLYHDYLHHIDLKPLFAALNEELAVSR